MTVHHLHIGCPDDGVEVNVDLTDVEVEGVRKVIAAHDAAAVDPHGWVGPSIVLDEPDACYRQAVYDRSKLHRLVGHRRPDAPACAAWWPSHASPEQLDEAYP